MLAYFRRIVGVMAVSVLALYKEAQAQQGGPAPSEPDVWIIFFGFIVAVIVLGVYIARSAILPKKTDYDRGEFGSKKDKTHEKYKSEWHDDYVEQVPQTKSAASHYDILGLKQTATSAEIKLRYRELAKKHHPDRTGEESEELVRINEAYEVLSDTERRRRYDESRH